MERELSWSPGNHAYFDSFQVIYFLKWVFYKKKKTSHIVNCDGLLFVAKAMSMSKYMIITFRFSLWIYPSIDGEHFSRTINAEPMLLPSTRKIRQTFEATLNILWKLHKSSTEVETHTSWHSRRNARSPVSQTTANRLRWISLAYYTSWYDPTLLSNFKMILWFINNRSVFGHCNRVPESL